MSTTPPTLPKKKSSKKTVLLIVFLGLIVLCVLIVIVSTNWAKTPEGQAAGTESAIKSTETALAKPIPPTKTQKPTETSKPTKTLAPTSTKVETPTPTNTPEFSGITFYEIKEFREGATEIQWEEYKEQLKGKRIAWSGTIDDVEKTLGSYFAWVCMDYYCLNRSYFTIENEELAFSLQKGQQISFEGYIDPSMMDFLDLFGFDVNIDYAVITSN